MNYSNGRMWDEYDKALNRVSELEAEIERLRDLLQAGLDSSNSEPDWFDWEEKVRDYLKGGDV